MKHLLDIVEIVGARISNGMDCAPEIIWSLARDDDDPKEITKEFELILKDPRYLKLVEINTRKYAVKHVEAIPFIRGIVQDAAVLANASLLEDLILQPEAIPFEQRRMLAKDLNTMLAKGFTKGLGETKSESEEKEEPLSAYDIAVQEDDELQKMLEKYPETMRESIMKRWKLEKLKVISQQEHAARSAF